MGMKLKDIMTDEVHVIPPSLSLTECALKMKEYDVGALPVCFNDRIVGVITDRDIVVKALAVRKIEELPHLTVKDIMSTPPVFAYEDEDVDVAVRLMEVKQIRRLIVLNREKRLVGIASLGDVAAKGHNRSLSGEVLEKVSEPTRGRAA
jgi:CBS domain-containing protein